MKSPETKRGNSNASKPANDEQKPQSFAEWKHLFYSNIDAIRTHYRLQETAGQQLGSNIMQELAFSYLAEALIATDQNRAWEPADTLKKSRSFRG